MIGQQIRHIPRLRPEKLFLVIDLHTSNFNFLENLTLTHEVDFPPQVHRPRHCLNIASASGCRLHSFGQSRPVIVIFRVPGKHN